MSLRLKHCNNIQRPAEEPDFEFCTRRYYAPPMPLPAYADWKAPKSDGALLLWPDAQPLLAAIPHNATRLSSNPTLILGVPAHEVRSATRTFLGHTDTSPLILTGHQTELHHPGVWIKNAVIDAVARKVGGRAMHLAVDTDAPKHLTLTYPLGTTGDAAAFPITDDPALATADWSGLVSAPSPAHITHLERTFAEQSESFGFTPLADNILASLRRLSLEESDLPRATTAAIHELDWHTLGLRYDAVLASPLWSSEGFALFTAHLIAHAPAYAAAYNAALADYRRQEGITTPGRPMPDLAVTSVSVELPFWLDDLGAGSRTRATATLQNNAWGITLNEDRFEPGAKEGWDAARNLQFFCRKHNHRFAPRALTLTTFCRLFLADLFLHGIGGGRYDQVTDRTIQTFFHTPPPAFAVATATLYHPWAQNRTRACLSCLHQEGHRLAHSLINKRNYLQSIESAPRRSRQRKAAYLAMHADLATAQQSSPALQSWRTRLTQSEQNAAADTHLFNRELFYALQPQHRLQELIAQVNRQIV